WNSPLASTFDPFCWACVVPAYRNRLATNTASPANLVRRILVNLLGRKRETGTHLSTGRAPQGRSGGVFESGAGAAPGNTSSGNGSSTTSSMNAFSGRNRSQAVPPTSRNTASSTAQSVRRVMGFPPTNRVGGGSKPAADPFRCLPPPRIATGRLRTSAGDCQPPSREVVRALRAGSPAQALVACRPPPL